MVAVGTPVFLLLPDASIKRVLHPGKVIQFTEGIYVAQFGGLPLPAEGTEVVAFYTKGNKFVQHRAIVTGRPEIGECTGGCAGECTGESADRDGEPVKLAFRLIGEAISAEQRQIYRVTLPLANIKARIGNETDCHIVDISQEGCAAIARQEYKLGSAVKISFSYEGHEVSADARVQTVKTHGNGKYRYGLLIPDKKSPARKALLAISMAVQRQQLKRMAGAA
jgi:hypothetical protein